LDLTIDYDKWIKNHFFGIGNESKFEDREYYTREPLDIKFVLSRGFSTKLVGQVGIRYKTVKNSNFQEDSRLFNTLPGINRSRATYTSVFSNLRYDTRDSFINPSGGLVVLGETEFTLKTKSSNVKFSRISALFHYYSVLFFTKTVLALRFGIQNLFGENLPVQVLLPVGGNNTLRGYPQDRFLGKTSAVFNVELRHPIFWRIGGVVGFDAGKVWNSLREIDLARWATNPTIGLRLYMNHFLVRFDIGFGRNSTGMYFNFGHIF
jgi:outer membrane protein assembly factor BamA